MSGESPGQLVASPVSKGGFRVLLYGVRLVPAVCVLALYAAKPNPEGAGVKAGTHGVPWGEARAPRALTQERPEDYLASSPERKNSRDEPESSTRPLETSPRGRHERGWPGDSKRSTEGSMKDHTTYNGAQRREGGVGRLAPAAWHTTARTANPARAGGSPGAAVACPQPALTGPATAALAGRSGTSPRLFPAGAVPVTPLGATRLRP